MMKVMMVHMMIAKLIIS
jgi:hypothetical protein